MDSETKSGVEEEVVMFDWLAECRECLRWRKMIQGFDVRNSPEVRGITRAPSPFL